MRLLAPALATGLAVSAALLPSPAEPPVDPLLVEAGGLRALCIPDAQRRWTYRPDARVVLHSAAVERVRVRTNSLGLRGPDVPAPPTRDRPGAVRVLFVGGSNTFGWGVPERRRYTELLSSRLAAEYPDMIVANAGHFSYDLEQQLALLRDVLPRVHPTLVFQVVSPRAVGLLAAHGKVNGAGTVLRGAWTWVLGLLRSAPAVPASAWRRGRSVLEESRREVEGSGARYVLVLLPDAPWSGRRWPGELDNAVRAGGRDVVDLRASLGAELFGPSGVWSIEGHDRVAWMLEPRLRAELDAIGLRRERRDLALVRRLVLSLDPEVGRLAAGGSSVAELATALRDLVHRRVPVRVPPPDFEFLPLFPAFRSAILGETGSNCGGIALTYMIALEAFGIRARYVGLHSAPVLGADSHASVEYADGPRWIASDPTFDVAFRARGRRLGWLEVRERLLAGEPVEISTDGHRVARARRIENYSLDRLVAYAVVYADLDGDGSLAADEIVTAPSGWDGTLRASGGGVAWHHAPFGVYRVLGFHAS